jgi:small subunit ribosomal protein S20
VAVHKSTEKRMRQNEVRRMRNRHVKTSVKTMVRRVRELVQAKDETKAKEVLARVIPLIDKAANKGVIHWRNRSRKISRLTRLVNGIGAKT